MSPSPDGGGTPAGQPLQPFHDQALPDPMIDLIITLVILKSPGLVSNAIKGMASRSTVSRGISWRLGSHKSAVKWANRMNKRGWTNESITETIQKGKVFNASNKVNPGNPASRYEFNGRSIIIDDVTNEILQLGAYGFKF